MAETLHHLMAKADSLLRAERLMKKRFVITAAFVALSVGAAHAADLPNAKAPPIFTAAPVYNWTGFYVNAGGGYGVWNASTTTTTPATGLCDLCTNQTQGGRGFIGTGGAGFDYQFTDHLVGGVFGDADFGQISGTIQDAGPFLAGSISNNWSWGVGARLGWLMTPELLAYGKAGFTQAHFTGTGMQDTFAGAYIGNSTPGFTTNGWLVGAGVETMFAPGWFFRTEYKVADYGAHQIADGGSFPAGNIRFQPIVQTVTSSLVYKFNWDSAPPAIPSLASLAVFQALAPAAATPWTGIYADAGVGYGLWSANTITLLPGTSVCALCLNQRQGGRGVTGTIGAGFDYQLTQHVVLGAFGDFDPSSLKGTIQDQGPYNVGTISEDWAWAAGARLGWLVTPQILSYVNAGFKQARFGGTQMVKAYDGSPSGTSTPGFTTDGWFLGGGVEAMFAPGWFLRGEYRYDTYGAQVLADASPTIRDDDIRFHPQAETATLGLVYKFNWTAPAPVVAKY
jgi:outer membrane immunogenic protein